MRAICASWLTVKSPIHAIDYLTNLTSCLPRSCISKCCGSQSHTYEGWSRTEAGVLCLCLLIPSCAIPPQQWVGSFSNSRVCRLPFCNGDCWGEALGKEGNHTPSARDAGQSCGARLDLQNFLSSVLRVKSRRAELGIWLIQTAGFYLAPTLSLRNVIFSLTSFSLILC